MAGAAGAIMDDATGVMKAMRETSPVASHLCLNVQFLGFAGSSGPSHVTYLNPISVQFSPLSGNIGTY